MYSIKLKDGTVLENLELNGNNYISETIIEDDTFQENLSEIEISDGESTETHKNMKLIANQIFDGKSWFVLGEKTRMDLIAESQSEQDELILDQQIELIELKWGL